MYLYSLIAILIIFAIGVIEFILGVPKGIDFGISLLTWVSFGFVGNHLYYRYTKRKVLKIKQKVKDEPLLENELEKRGGTSWLSVVILVLLFILLSFLAA